MNKDITKEDIFNYMSREEYYKNSDVRKITKIIEVGNIYERTFNLSQIPSESPLYKRCLESGGSITIRFIRIIVDKWKKGTIETIAPMHRINFSQEFSSFKSNSTTGINYDNFLIWKRDNKLEKLGI